jgi:hypothetical protein
MSDLPASYAFLPWLRRGMASEIDRPDGSMTGAPRALVLLTLSLDASGERRDVPVPVALHGPGEIGGIDRRVVIRTVPKSGEVDAEPNYFASIEFDQSDFPWRYTAASADGKARLRPWLVLAVLRTDEIEDEASPLEGRLGAITVANGSALPRPAQSWAWAHAQVEAFDPASETIASLVKDQPRRVRSRLLCPRRLAPNTAYRAILIPAFERGRRAGLEQVLDDSIDALAPAWSEEGTHIRLPVYYEWRFQTGVKGDFETLAKKLIARPVDDALGRIDMDVQTPDPALPPAASGPLAYEGALVSPRMTGTPWPGADRASFTGPLSLMLNQPAQNLVEEGGETILAPPLWGRWHAAHDRLDMAPSAHPLWFHELNSDPRHRVAAGLGAEIVRQQDQQLMAAAWDQVEGIRDANAELRRAQLAREAASKLHAKHFAALDRDTFLIVTSPLQSRFTASPLTMSQILRQSPVPLGVMDGQFRRIVRPRGAIARRARIVVQGVRASLLERLNSGTLRARPDLPTPGGLVSPVNLAIKDAVTMSPAWLTWLALFALALFLLFVLLAFTGLFVIAAVTLVAAGAVGYAARQARRRLQRESDARTLIEGTISAEAVSRAQPMDDFVPSVSNVGSAHRPVPVDTKGSASDQEPVAALRAALTDLAEELDIPLRPGAILEPADLPHLHRTLLTKMDPRLTIPAAITHRLHIADWLSWTYEDPLEPVMAAPDFDTPMYEPLRDYGEMWLMPGIGTIPPETVTLVASNQSFIEAYMTGLSHEMGRELLYHEYPTDQRGTYFRQFWDVRGARSPAGSAPNPDSLRDIKRIHEWRADLPLGQHSARSPALKPGNLVFLIKGELLRRYPETMVYAVRTIIKNGQRVLGTEEKFPVFEGRLSPDIRFFGFDFIAGDVRGNDDPALDQGWYFLLQEQPTEPLFGLDSDDGRYGAQLGSWNDLNWAHLAASADGLDALHYIDLDAELPDTSRVVAGVNDPPLAWHAASGRGPAGANSSDLAHITLQRPFRVAIHGSDMLAGEAS